MKSFKADSNTEYIQSINLPAGQYTFSAIVQSPNMKYSFAIKEIGGWRTFNLNLHTTEFKKVSITFKTDGVTEFNLVSNASDFNVNNPIEVVSPMLEGGTIASTPKRHVLDFTEEMQIVWKEIGEVNKSISDFKTYVSGSFADGIIDQAEAKAIEKYINLINAEKFDIDNQYDKIYNDALLTDPAKTYLSGSKASYDIAHLNLSGSISSSISDGKTNANEKSIVDSNFTVYKEKLGELTISFRDAITAIDKARIDGVQIGGRNLLLNSYEIVTPNYATDGDNHAYFDDRTCDLIAGETYIVKGVCPSGLDWSDKHGVVSSTNAVLWLSGANGYHQIISSDTTGTTGTIFTVSVSQRYTLRTNVYKAGQYTFSKIKIEKGNKATDWTPAPEDVQAAIDAAIVKATYWSVKASAPVIYKDAINAATAGTHTPVTVSGELRSGTTTTQGGFITVTPNGSTEAETATASPVTIAPADNVGKTSYTVRLYDTAAKKKLLDTMTIPVVFKGASGVNAISAVLSNEADVLPASPEGVVSDYSGSGTEIRVFEGATELDYDGIGMANGKFNVTASATGITAGAKSESDQTCVFANASNMTSDNATITFTITGKTASGTSFSLTKVQSFAKSRTGQKGDTGASAPLLYLSTSAQVMKCNPDNTPQTGQTISIEAKLQNVSGTATFVATPYNDAGVAQTPVTLDGTGNTRTLTNAQWLATYKRIEVVATLGSLNDKVTIYRVADGATGQNAIVGLLTNESVTLQANNAGIVSSFTPANGEFWVYNGTTKVTSGITFSKVSETGCTAAITSEGAYSVSAMSADNATVMLRAVYGGVTIDKVLTLSKSRAGADGTNGVSVKSVVIQYAKNKSKTDAPTSESDWGTTRPDWERGFYLWQRTYTTYSDNTFSIGTPSLDNTWQEQGKIIDLENKTKFIGTVIEDNAVATGTLLIGNSEGTTAGITGITDKEDNKSVRFWAGSTYKDSSEAPFLVRQDGSVRMTRAEITGYSTKDEVKTAINNAKEYTDSQAVHTKVMMESYMDGIITDAERLAITAAENALTEAYNRLLELRQNIASGGAQLLREYDIAFDFRYWGGTGTSEDIDLNEITVIEAFAMGGLVGTTAFDYVDENGKKIEIIY